MFELNLRQIRYYADKSSHNQDKYVKYIPNNQNDEAYSLHITVIVYLKIKYKIMFFVPIPKLIHSFSTSM